MAARLDQEGEGGGTERSQATVLLRLCALKACARMDHHSVADSQRQRGQKSSQPHKAVVQLGPPQSQELIVLHLHT